MSLPHSTIKNQTAQLFGLKQEHLCSSPLVLQCCNSKWVWRSFGVNPEKDIRRKHGNKQMRETGLDFVRIRHQTMDCACASITYLYSFSTFEGASYRRCNMDKSSSCVKDSIKFVSENRKIVCTEPRWSLDVSVLSSSLMLIANFFPSDVNRADMRSHVQNSDSTITSDGDKLELKKVNTSKKILDMNNV